MYTMMLLMTVSSSGDVEGFGHRNKGCTGSQVAYASCSGYAAPSASCYGSSCSGYAAPAAGCTGGGKSFLGLHDRTGGGGFLGGLCGKKKATGCSGYAAPAASCHGYSAPAASCHGYNSGYSAPAASCHGYSSGYAAPGASCHGNNVAAPAADCCGSSSYATPSYSTGCTGGIVGGYTPSTSMMPGTTYQGTEIPGTMSEGTPMLENAAPEAMPGAVDPLNPGKSDVPDAIEAPKKSKL